MDHSLPNGWTPVAPTFPAPGGVMRRLEGPKGELGMMIKYRPELAHEPLMVDGLMEVMPFLKDPGHPGIARLLFWDRRQGMFIYDLDGDKALLSEIVEHSARRGEAPRAAMELLAASGALLDSAARTARDHGLESHQSLDPTRVLVDREGQVSLLGYGIPDMEAISALDREHRPDRVVYWPPERIRDGRETVASDIYAMGVIAAELASGQTLLDGVPPGEAVAIIVGESGGIRTEIQQLGGLSPEVRHLLVKLVQKEAADRPLAASQMGLEASALASELPGDTLSELAQSSLDDAPPSRRWSPEEATAMSLDTLGLGTVDEAEDEDDTARIDPALMAPVPPMRTDPLYGEVDPAERTWEVPLEPDDESIDIDDWDKDIEDDDSWTAESASDDWSEEVPNKVSQYLDSGAFASPTREALGKRAADSDRSPRPPPDEVLRSDFTDPQGQQPQLPFDSSWELGTPLDAPEPSLVDGDDDDGPSFQHDPEALRHSIGGIETRRPTLSAEDIERAEAEARREVDAEIDAALAAHRAEEQRAEELLSGLPQVDDDEPWDEDGPASVTMELFEPMGDAPKAWPDQFEAPFGQDDEVEDDVDVEPGDLPISVSLARESWKDGPHQLLLTAAKVDLGALRVLHDQIGLTSLSRHQAALLGYLSENPERELSTDELFHGAMLGEEGTPRSVPRIIARLRQKIERDPQDPDHLINGEHGGFVFLPGEIVPSGPPALPEVGPLPGLENSVLEVTDALRKDGFVTVIGPPGAGASEVALRAAVLLAEEGYEVHRAVVGGLESHVDRIAKGLGIRRIGREPLEILDDIGRRLAARDDLIVFLDAPKEMGELRGDVQRLVRMHPRGLILVAGRGALELPGEFPIRLRPLTVEKAVELFRQRVAFYRSGTRVSDELAAAVAAQLDRMPMALEAAARRTGFVAPEALLQQLEAGHGLQDDGGGLEADIAALIDQCDPVERKVLEQLVVFSDGFELAAAEDVVDVADPGRGLNTVLDTLTARQILQRVSEEPARWALYAQAGAAVLRRNDDASLIEAARERHARTFGQIGLELGAGPWVERIARDALVREQKNLWAVLQHPRPETIPESAGAALGLTSIIGKQEAGRLREAVDRLLGRVERSAGMPDAVDWTSPDHARWKAAARLAGARLDLHLGQPMKARSALREAAQLAPDQVRLLADVAWLHAELGAAYESEAALNKISTADEWVRGVIALLRGRIHMAKTYVRKGERAFIEALHTFGQLDADIGQAQVQRHLAEVYVERGKGRRATPVVREALQTFEAVEDVPNVLRCRIRIAELHVGLGERDLALEELTLIQEMARQHAANGQLALARGLLGVVRTMERDFEEGERLFFLALAGSAPDQNRIQALFALALLLQGDHDDIALEEAKGATPDAVAQAVVASLSRSAPPHENESAFLLYEALESWRAGAALARFEEELDDRPSIAVRMVLQCPQPRQSA